MAKSENFKNNIDMKNLQGPALRYLDSNLAPWEMFQQIKILLKIVRIKSSDVTVPLPD